MLQVINDNNLIGDTIGTFQVMQYLSTVYNGISVKVNPEARQLYSLMPQHYPIKYISSVDYEKPHIYLDTLSAYAVAEHHGLYMSHAYFKLLGLDLPDTTVPELSYRYLETATYDYLVAPFSRSLPPEQRWSWYKWAALIIALEEQGNTVAVLGSSKHDEPFPGFTNEFDRPMEEVISLLKNCRKGVISGVTGISHLCHALGVRNYVMTNQYGFWGNTPSSKKLGDRIPELDVQTFLAFIQA